jgi:small acid-soluble spore protein (thioredoxin-like protein)
MKNKPDDRRDNVENIQFNINHTIQNIEQSEETIANTEDEEMKQDLEAKNDRRREALHAMKEEIKDEAWDRKKGYK